MKEKNEVSNRFIRAYERLLADGTVTDKKTFAAGIGISPSMVTEIHKGRSSVGTAAIQNLVLVYNVSPDWLLTGDGEMLRSEREPSNIEITTINQSKRIEKKEEMQVVNLYDFRAAAGLKTILENSRADILDTIHVPNLPKCYGGIYVIGDSMYPLLKPGDIILYKKQTIDIQNIVYGKIYILSYNIDGDDYAVIKYVRRSEQGEPYLSLESENPEHAASELDFRRVTAIALVKAMIRVGSLI